MTARKYLIGLDNGGTSTKAAVFDTEGNAIASYGQKTAVITPEPGYTERDMEALWAANCSCIREAIKKAGIDNNDILGVAVCGHGKGLYAWGKDNRPAYNGIISTDNRAWRYPEKWKKEGTIDRLHDRLCQNILACQQVSLLAWLKDHKRDVYDNIQYVFSVKDYIRYRLTGEAYSEATDISGSGLMNVLEARFDEEILEAFGIPEVMDKLPPIKYSYEACGTVTKEAAELTGLREGTPVAGGMFDIDACAIACGVTTPEELVTIGGTWSINEFISKAPITNGKILMNSLYAIPGYYLAEECSATSSGNIEWIINNCVDKSKIPDGMNEYAYIEQLIEEIDPEKSDVYYLPFLYGSNAHPLGKASFIGLTNFHSSGDMLRAAYEGVAYSHKRHIEKLLSARKAPEAIRMAGGPTRSKVWVQLFADVLGYPIETVDADEIGALGCAMAAAVAAGVYSDYNEAAEHMVRISERTSPDSDRTAVYKKKYEKYIKVSDALDGVWGDFEV